MPTPRACNHFSNSIAQRGFFFRSILFRLCRMVICMQTSNERAGIGRVDARQEKINVKSVAGGCSGTPRCVPELAFSAGAELRGPWVCPIVRSTRALSRGACSCSEGTIWWKEVQEPWRDHTRRTWTRVPYVSLERMLADDERAWR